MVDIFRSPVKSEVYLQSSQSGSHQLRVFDVTRKIVLTEALSLSIGEQTIVTLKELTPGVYTMTITIGESFTTSKLSIE